MMERGGGFLWGKRGVFGDLIENGGFGGKNGDFYRKMGFSWVFGQEIGKK